MKKNYYLPIDPLTLKYFREYENLTLEQASVVTSFSVETLRKFENGKQKIASMEEGYKLAKAYNTNLSALYVKRLNLEVSIYCDKIEEIAKQLENLSNSMYTDIRRVQYIIEEQQNENK